MTSRFGIKRVCRRLVALLSAAPLLVIPISLLEVARDGAVSTQIWPNGTAYRRVEATVVEPNDRKGAEQLFEDHFGVRPSVHIDGTRLSADWRIGVMEKQRGAVLKQTGRWLLDMHTTYEFEEEINSSQHALTKGEQELIFTYELEMPGRIVETDPPPAFAEGGTARWRIKTADLHTERGMNAPVTVKATSRRFKCGNATIALYVALWAAGWIMVTVGRRVRARPKRI